MADLAAYRKLIEEAEKAGSLAGFLASMKQRLDSGQPLSPKMEAALDRMVEQGTGGRIQEDPTLRTRFRTRFIVLSRMKLGYTEEFVRSLFQQFEKKGVLSEKQIVALNKTIKKFRNQLDELQDKKLISKDEIQEMFSAIAELPSDEYDLQHKFQIEIICDGHASQWTPGPWDDSIEARLRAMAEDRLKATPRWLKKAQDKYELADNISRPYRSELEMQCREVMKNGKVVNWFYYLRAASEVGDNQKLFFYKG